MYHIIKGGRFGNNIIQLINCIKLALQTGVSTIKHSFDFMKTDSLTINEYKICSNSKCTYKVHTNSKVSLTHCCRGCKNGQHGSLCEKNLVPKSASSYFKNIGDMKKIYSDFNPHIDIRFIIEKYIKPSIIFNTDIRYTKYNSNSLFVHIRSGDIFSDNWVSSCYVQPPLEYYIKIFELPENKNKNIFIFAEDRKNPVVNILSKLYPNISIQTLDIKDIIGIFMQAKYVVSGNGTFILSILMFNTNLEVHYTSGAGGKSGGGIPYLQYFLKRETPKTVLARFPNYIKAWSNTEEQRSLMITYRGVIFKKRRLPKNQFKLALGSNSNGTI